MADPGTLLATTHEVGDGTRVRLRLARPSDAGRLREFLDRAQGSADMPVRRFTLYDPRERLVVAATAWRGGSEEVVGVAEVGAGGELVIAEDGVTKLLHEAAESLERTRARAA